MQFDFIALQNSILVRTHSRIFYIFFFCALFFTFREIILIVKNVAICMFVYARNSYWLFGFKNTFFSCAMLCLGWMAIDHDNMYVNVATDIYN